MNIYLAPLEGITGSVFRQTQLKHFGCVDKYFTPFISASGKAVLTPKILEDILPENNIGQRLVPQILSKSAESFLDMCEVLEQYGYSEFNLNLGCPSGTVTAKGKGSGFLAYPDELNMFLEKIYKSSYSISIKTRIGYKSSEEFYRLLEIYNQYPVTELIIHPRTGRDMYKNTPNMQIYKYAEENSRSELCYNGDIFSVGDYNSLVQDINSDKVMLGRGVVMNPALPRLIKEGITPDKEEIKSFCFDLYYGYKQVMPGSVPLLHKMKEFMTYLLMSFENSDNSKLAKKVKKAKNSAEFENALYELFEAGVLREM